MGHAKTAAARERFLDGLACGMRVNEAAAWAGLSQSRAYALRGTDSEFAAAWEAAQIAARPVPRPLAPFDALTARDGRLALLLDCHPLEQEPVDVPEDAAVPCRAVTALAKEEFLEGLAAGLTIRQAAARARLARAGVYRLKSRDPVFAAAWDDIAAEVSGMAETEARRRVLGGSTMECFAETLPSEPRKDAAADRMLMALATHSRRRLDALRAERAAGWPARERIPLHDRFLVAFVLHRLPAFRLIVSMQDQFSCLFCPALRDAERGIRSYQNLAWGGKMNSITITYAKAHLSALVDRIEANESIEITRRGKPVARLTVAPRPRRPIDQARLRALTDSIPPQAEKAAELVRKMRDHDRY